MENRQLLFNGAEMTAREQAATPVNDPAVGFAPRGARNAPNAGVRPAIAAHVQVAANEAPARGGPTRPGRRFALAGRRRRWLLRLHIEIHFRSYAQNRARTPSPSDSRTTRRAPADGAVRLRADRVEHFSIFRQCSVRVNDYNKGRWRRGRRGRRAINLISRSTLIPPRTHRSFNLLMHRVARSAAPAAVYCRERNFVNTLN
ncbi:hypothetical protein EVAR_9342_1 [Eumeta japonica]|uniref:Uncharacterized protein n=1 Tax=Eumeta variegata TaxID=151549 RepID=A0A4C1YVK2_EUMVA|nr:hypothetical protein EVAR_9342_1 [Eumeta japonica]